MKRHVLYVLKIGYDYWNECYDYLPINDNYLQHYGNGVSVFQAIDKVGIKLSEVTSYAYREFEGGSSLQLYIGEYPDEYWDN